MTTNEKIQALRQQMADAQVDYYIVNTADPHQSEYLSEHFKERAWLTGFTGSAGTALVSKDQALVWADGRYFIQAARQIEGSEFKLMKMATPGYPSLNEWLRQEVKAGEVLGLNEASYSQRNFEFLSQLLSAQGASVKALPSLIAPIWQDRPAMPEAKIFSHDLQFTGQEAREKIAQVRKQMEADQAQANIVVGLDDVAWLYNYRGGDVANNPVALAFALITTDEAYLFIDEKKVSPAMRQIFSDQGITLLPYKQVSNKLSQLKVEKIVLDKRLVNRKLYQAILQETKILDKPSYVTQTKACLNPVELENQKKAYIRDSAAITRYLFWLKRQVKTGELNEWNAAEKLHELRSQGENFLDESFSSISAYGPNAAMMHYAPSAENFSKLEAKSFYLIDSGGQYFDGTTDITRTIALGSLTAEEKTDFTLTLKSHINLARAIFLAGTTGTQLDILAREPLWQHFMDYKCGTGHGVGYVLGVHEGPQRFSTAPSNVALKEGMHITIEPGVYKEGLHGIRLENDYVVTYAGENPPDRYLKLEVMSYVPLDNEAIIPELLSDQEIDWLNDYHAAVLEKIMPYMTTDSEKSDLEAACRPLSK